MALVLSILAVSLSASVALAQNPHFIASPQITDLGNQLQATGRIAGLGNRPVIVLLTAIGVASIQCFNPAGHLVPAQSKTIAVTTTGQSPILQRGSVTFNVTTRRPAVTSPPACPNPRWTARIRNVKFTHATLFVLQPATGNVLLQRTFTL